MTVAVVALAVLATGLAAAAAYLVRRNGKGAELLAAEQSAHLATQADLGMTKIARDKAEQDLRDTADRLVDERRRLEMVIAAKETELVRLREAAIAGATPEQLREMVNDMLRGRR